MGRKTVTANDGIGYRFGLALDLFPSRKVAAQYFGTSGNQLWRFATEKADIPSRIVRLICAKHGLSANWLLFGEGPMYKAKNAANQPSSTSQDGESAESIPSMVTDICRRIDALSVAVRDRLGDRGDGLLLIMAAQGLLSRADRARMSQMCDLLEEN